MPNAMNRFKPNQLIKVEKENENKDIKRRLKTTSKDRPAGTKPETVWERLSKVKKCSSNEDSVGSQPTRSRHTLNSKSSHRIPTVRLAAPIKKPLSPHTLTNKRPEKKTLKKSKLTKENCKSVGVTAKHEKSVKEILTARSMSNSKSSSDENKVGCRRLTPRMIPEPCQFYSHTDDFDFLKLTQSTTSGVSQESFEQFEMAPLMPVPTRGSLNCSSMIAKNFRDLLEQKKRTMAPEEIKIVKEVIKTDERHHQLQKDDAHLFKEILKTQLQEIIKQELVVKSALNKLDSTMEVPALTVVEKSVAFAPAETQSQQQVPQVDVIFKNVPTLEKEIIILKALGEKLEATLKRTVSRSNLNVNSNIKVEVPKSVKSSAVTVTSTSPLKTNTDMATNTSNSVNIAMANSNTTTNTNSCTRTKNSSGIIAPPKVIITDTLHEVNFMLENENNAQVRVERTGVKQSKGLVHEYRIVQKTIMELKKEASRHFYLPINEKKTELKRTSFKRLKDHPDVLMRHLKPKNSLVPFNVLDQDPIFFNSFLRNMSTPTKKSSTGLDSYPSSQPSSRSNISEHMVTMLEGGDSTMGARLPYYLQAKEPLKIEEIHYPHEDIEICKELKPKLSYTAIVQPEVVLPKVVLPQEVPPAEAVTPEVVVTPEIVITPKVITPPIMKSVSVVKMIVPPKKFDKTIPTTQPQTAPPPPPLPPAPLDVAPIRGKQRRRIRRSFTPMPEHKSIEPKNHLLKTILVGSVQISVFLILIMAITYPDIKC